MTHGNFNCKINCLNDGLVVLGLATSHHENKTDAGTPDWPSLVSPSMVSVFVGRRLTMTLLPPALKWILKLKTAVEVDKSSRREKKENQTKSKNRHHQVEV
jgi:hypothetical protein